jgi:hypothetical protein
MATSAATVLDDAELRRKIVGTWKLVSVAYEDAVNGERTSLYGAHPKGIQIATPAGRWLALMTAEGRDVPNGDAERAQALKTMIAYTGRYRVEDGKVITKVEAAWNEAWVGTEQIRQIRFHGDKLLLQSPPMPHPNIDGKTVCVLVEWEPEKS